MGCDAASTPAASHFAEDYETPDWRGRSKKGTLWPEERHLEQEGKDCNMCKQHFNASYTQLLLKCKY